MNHCMRHFEEPVAALCRTCNRPFCGRCLVYSFGPKKPPYCVGCALTASGVRNNAKVAVATIHAPRGADRRLERAQRRAEKHQAKADAKAQKRPDDVEPEPEPAVALDHLATSSSRFSVTSAEKVS